MKFHNRLHVSPLAGRHKQKIVQRLKEGKFLPDVYVLVLPSGDFNQLEIYSSRMLRQVLQHNGQVYIVGFAYGYEEALILVRDIAEDAYKKTGTCDIIKYIEQERSKKG